MSRNTTLLGPHLRVGSEFAYVGELFEEAYLVALDGIWIGIVKVGLLRSLVDGDFQQGYDLAELCSYEFGVGDVLSDTWNVQFQFFGIRCMALTRK